MADREGCLARRCEPVPFSAQGVSTPLALMAVIAGAFVLLTPGPAPTTPIPAVGKVAERLVAGELPPTARPSLLPQTIAMFALPQADARTWTERPVGPSALDTPPAVAKPRLAALPRIAQAEADGQRRAAPVPPSRPAPAAPAVAALPPAEPAAKPASAEPVRVLGWAVPGSERLPVVGGALRAVTSVGSRAASAGLDTAASVGRGVVGFAEWTAEVVGLRSAPD